MYYFPARVIQYTEKGEGHVTWLSNSTIDGERKGRLQIFLSKIAPWLLAVAFLLQMPALLLPLFGKSPDSPAPNAHGEDQRIAAPTNVNKDLQYAQLCTRAMKEFRAQPEWNNEDEPRTFTSHYNKKLGKCLVKVTSTNLTSGVILEMQHIYDALEGTVLAGEILRKEISHNGEQKDLTISMVKNGKLLKDKDEIRETHQWFETLMIE